jgi:hypothetical protein
LKNCTKLEVVDIGWNKHIDEADIINLLKLIPKTVHTLKISGNSQCSQNTFEQIAKMNWLQSLSLRWNNQLTYKWIKLILKGCRELERLDVGVLLSECINVIVVREFG